MMEELDALRVKLEELETLRARVALCESVLAQVHVVVSGEDTSASDWKRVREALEPYKHVLTYDEVYDLASELDKHRAEPTAYGVYMIHRPYWRWEITRDGQPIPGTEDFDYSHDVAKWLLDERYAQSQLWDSAVGSL